MICLKNRTFAVSQTTGLVRFQVRPQLWFAWKIVLLQYHKQHKSGWIALHPGCDLLEKSYFCSITNNDRAKPQPKDELWFAWKIVLLQYHKQLVGLVRRRFLSCDLLEKSYFCSITNNVKEVVQPVLTVVICLKNRTFAVSQTTS